MSEIELRLGTSGRIDATARFVAADVVGVFADPAAAPRAVELDLDGTPLAPTDARVRGDDGHEVVDLAWAHTDGKQLRIGGGLFDRLPLGHRVYVTARTPDGALAAEAVLSARRPSFDLPLDPRARE